MRLEHGLVDVEGGRARVRVEGGAVCAFVEVMLSLLVLRQRWHL